MELRLSVGARGEGLGENEKCHHHFSIIPLMELLNKKQTLESHHAPDKFQHKYNKRHSDNAAECMNPGRLRNRQIRTLSREEAKCFAPLVEAKFAETEQTLLRCDLMNFIGAGERPFAESIQWIFK